MRGHKRQPQRWAGAINNGQGISTVVRTGKWGTNEGGGVRVTA